MKKKIKKINAAILVIGNEILSGRTQDKNVVFISNWLNIKCGISVKEVRIIPDVEKIIVENILLLSKKFNYVFTTGGIGPTHDDITAQSISKAFKVKYEYHKEAYRILEKYYGQKKFNEGRKKMAKMPRGAKLIYNPSSAAPGFIIKNVLSLPGVPSILNSMIENCKRYLVKGLKVHSITINLYTVESNISKELGLLQERYKKFIEIGSYPFFRLGKIGVAIVMRSNSILKLKKLKKELIKLIKLKKIKILKI
ncbi:competence/damage-inducible protein A [Candidatus Pelagibacter bacterium]|jgi:molybdenum cofactor synthesis domain-containing protein|nr:competence/damage-inducible protein A [Candidatus Pelagibacter bacterium]|tara:strand:- start:753 stop:1511 length:759 start_codon:yes stop_codon:yes gene_type:complete